MAFVPDVEAVYKPGYYMIIGTYLRNDAETGYKEKKVFVTDVMYGNTPYEAAILFKSTYYNISFTGIFGMPQIL